MRARCLGPLVLTLATACRPKVPATVVDHAPAAEHPSPPAIETPTSDVPLVGRALLDGLPSIEAACEQIATTFKLPANASEDEKPACDAEDAHLVEDDWGMLVVYYEYAELYFPLIRTEAGWSVNRPVLQTWSSGAEFNTELDGIVGERYSVVPGHGEQLLIELSATLIQSHFDNPIDRFEHHRRLILCMWERDTAWCTPAVMTSLVVEEVATDEYDPKPRNISSFEPRVSFEDGMLIVAGADARRLAQRSAYDEDFLAYLVPAGRYEISEVLDWPWPDSDWQR